MKKCLLKLLVISCLVFLGFTTANAAATFGTTSTTGFYSTTLTASGTNQGVFGFSYKNTTGYNLSQLDLSTSISPTFFSNYKLYVSTTNTLASAVAAGSISESTTAGDFVQTSATDLTANFDANLTTTANTTYYFFLVADFTLPAASTTFTINSISVTRANGTVINGTATAITYTITVPAAVTITATSLNTATNPTQPTAGLQGNPISALGNMLPIYGLQLATSATGATKTITALNFTQAGGQNNNYYMANAYLYSSTTASYSAGTSTLLQTITGVGATTALNFTGLSLTETAGAGPQYYFVLIDYTTATAAAANFQLNFTSATGATVTGTPAGYTYNFTSTTITATALGVTGGPLNGLTTNPIATTATGLPIYGVQLTASATTAPAKTITSLTFTSTAPQVNNYYFTNFYLYSSTSSTFPGVGGPGVAQVGSTVPAGNNNTVTFGALNISVATGATLYYFVVADYTTYIAAATSTFQLNFGSAVGATIAAGAGNTGFNYTITSPTFTFTSNASGIQAAAVPYYYGTTGDALESFGVTATTAATLTSVTLKSTTAFSTYFSNMTVFYSTNANYAAAVAGGQLTAANITTSGTTTLVVTFAAPVPIGTTALYFYVLGDFTLGDNSLPATFQFKITNATATSGGSAITFTNTANINGTTYNLISPIVLGTASTTGLATANQLNYNQTGVGILGFAVTNNSTTTYPQAETITTMDFSAAISTYTSTIGTFFSNVKLYVSTSNSFAAATPVPAGYNVSSLTSTSNTFTISGLSQVIPINTTYYYFIVADFTDPINFSSTIALSCTDVINTTPVTFTDGAPITGTTYNCNPSVTLAAATTTGLAANPITASATGIGIFGFSVKSGPALTFTTFNLYTTQPTGYTVGSDFANFKLYVSNTNNFGAATAVAGATFTITNPSTLTITGLSQAISGTTKYYFIVADYTVPSVATTFELNLQSVATSTNTYTTGAPIYGTDYLLTGPLGVYYWTGASASVNWESADNWLNAYTGTASGWPGQSSNTDIAVFSPTYETYPSAVITTTKTIGQVIVTSGNTTNFIFYIKNGLTCTITNGITLGDPGQTGTKHSQLEFANYNTSTTGTFYIGGTSSFYNNGIFVVEANTVFTSSPVTPVVNIYGTATYPAFIDLLSAAGNLTANSTTFNLSGEGAEIYAPNGTFTANNSILNFSGFGAQIYADGNNTTMTLNGSTVNATGTSDSQYITGIGVSAGTFTATSSSVINLGTSSSAGIFTCINANGGTFTLSGGSTINMIGNNAFIDNDDATYNITGVAGSPSTINMGSTGGSDGVYTEISNTDEGFFNLNAYSIINMNGANSEIYNTSTGSGANTYYGVFIAASTSVINPTSTSALITNANASNYFTLLSDINGSATIGQLGAGARIAGQYNVQRYLNGGSLYLRNYRLLSSPVNMDGATSNPYNQIDLSYLGATATIPYTSPTTTYYGSFIGGPDASFGGGVHTLPNPLMYLYQENIAPGTGYNSSFTSGKNVGIMSLNSTNHTLGTSNTASGYGSGSATTAPSVASTSIPRPGYDSSTGVSVPPGNGYIMYYVGNSQDAAPSTATAPTSSNINAQGYINQSQVQLYMWGSGSGYLTDTYGLSGIRLPGITVIGNPYPSTIDLAKVWSDNSHAIIPTLYQLDKTNQQFDTYNASTNISSTSLSSEYVASGQGFYIHVDSLGTTHNFYFQEDQKTPSATAPFFPPISNFAVIPHSGITTDNVSRGTTGNVTSDAATTGSKTNYFVAPVKAQPNSVGGYAINNASMISMASIQPVDSVAKVLAAGKTDSGTTRRAAEAHMPLIIPNHAPRTGFGKQEAQQPKQSPPPPGITNPANLHLKFVVDSVDYDEVALAFNKSWSDKFDSNDSYDLDGQAGKVYLSSYSSDHVRTSINLLGDYTGGKRVKLFVKASTAGIFQVQMSDIKNFDTNDYSVFLLDKLKADSLDLTLYKSYNFNYAPGTASDSTRFVLAIEHKPVPYYALLTFAGQKVTPGVQLNWQTKNLGNKTTFILQKLTAGNVYVAIDSLQSDTSGEFNYIDQHPTLGNNTYRLEQINELGAITYSAPVTIGYNSTNPNGGLVLYPNPAKSTMTVTLTTSSTAVQVATADIYNAQGKLIEHKVVNSNSFVHDVSAYALGAYIIELKNSNGVLVGQSKFVKVE